MGSYNSTPSTAGAIPLRVWRGKNGQRLRRALARHERMVTSACSDDRVTSKRLIQLNKRYDQILLAAVTVVPR